MKLFFVINLFLFSSSFAFGQGYQKSFYFEDGFRKKIKVANRIFDALKQDVQIQDCIRRAKKKIVLSNWFRATKINLNNDGLADVIVEPIGTGKCRTAMRPPYWILLNKDGKYDLVLTANTFFLYINREKNNNHFNITIDWSTANTHFKTTYGFGGKRYKRIAHLEKPNI